MSPSCPYHSVAVLATTMLCASIIFPITPPQLLADAIKVGDTPTCSAEILCKLPNNTLEEVSEPVSATPNQPTAPSTSVSCAAFPQPRAPRTSTGNAGSGPERSAQGLTAVTSIAFDAKGRLLATELSTGGLLAAGTAPGALIRISADGKHVTTLPVSGLSEPTGVAVAPTGAVYVSNRGTSPGSAKQPGEVLEITGLK